jgi:hypothetical protein
MTEKVRKMEQGKQGSRRKDEKQDKMRQDIKRKGKMGPCRKGRIRVGYGKENKEEGQMGTWEERKTVRGYQ